MDNLDNLDNLDNSEIIIKDLNRSIVNLYKLCFEEMGYDLGVTYNKIEYKNYLYDNPLHLTNTDKSFDEVVKDIEELGVSNMKSEAAMIENYLNKSMDVLWVTADTVNFMISYLLFLSVDIFYFCFALCFVLFLQKLSCFLCLYLLFSFSTPFFSHMSFKQQR